MKQRKRKVRYDNLCLVIFGVIAIILAVVVAMMAFRVIKEMKGSSAQNEVVSEIKDYHYQLKESNTEYFKKVYEELETLLSKEEKEENFEEEYAKYITQLFLADFFDLDSKNDKADVGGVQFVWESYRETFKDFATDPSGIYYYVENNVSKDRTQELPAVEEVTIEKIEKIRYSKGDIQDENAYYVTATITYEKNLGYPTTVTLTLLHNQDKLEVIAMK